MSNEQQRWVKILPSAVESKYDWDGVIGSVWRVSHEVADLIVLYQNDKYMEPIERHHVQEVYVYDEPRELPTAKPMKVRVVKAGRGSWYETQVGEEFNVLEERKSDYIVEKVGDTWYHIDKSDCEVVTETEHEKMSDEQSAFLQRIAELERLVVDLQEQQRITVEQLAKFSITLLKLSNAVSPIGSPLDPAPQAESNLDKARRIYYKGVKFKCAFLGDEYVSSGKIRLSHGDDRNIVCEINGNPKFLLCDGHWAEIVGDGNAPHR